MKIFRSRYAVSKYFTICTRTRRHISAIFFLSFWITRVSSLYYCWSINIYLYMYIYTDHILYIFYSLYIILRRRWCLIFLLKKKDNIDSVYGLRTVLKGSSFTFHWGMALGFQIKLPICSKHSPVLLLLVVSVCVTTNFNIFFIPYISQELYEISNAWKRTLY